MAAGLDVWIARAGDICLLDEDHWLIDVLDTHSSIFSWGGKSYGALEAPQGHWFGTLPPGTYVVRARRKSPKGPADASDHTIVTLGCEGVVCVRLYLRPRREQEPNPPPDRPSDHPEDHPHDHDHGHTRQPRGAQKADEPTGRPPLTADALNAAADVVFSGSPEAEAHARQVERDWRAYVLASFRLKSRQKESLDAIPPEVVEDIQRALRQALESGGGSARIRLVSGSKRADARGELVVSAAKRSRQGGGGSAARLKVPILRCTFDADCRDWDCTWP